MDGYEETDFYFSGELGIEFVNQDQTPPFPFSGPQKSVRLVMLRCIKQIAALRTSFAGGLGRTFSTLPAR
ncbi:MAG: hypothetical protein AB7O39_14090 [Flavobacteriaceae bacterium]